LLIVPETGELLHGIFPLFLRSMRSDARSLVVHLSWSLLVIGVYVALCVVIWNRMSIGAPGLGFLINIAYLDAAVLCLIGTPFFSSSISEEREEGTLGLMRMAGINSLGILLGQSFGRLLQTLLLLAIQFPFWWLAVTLGGVTTGQLWALGIGMAAFVIALSNVGLLCSVLCSTTRSAAGVTGVILAAHILLAHMERSLFGISGPLELTCFWLRIPVILSTGFNETPWSLQFTSNLAMGAACFVLSWFFFGIARDELTGSVSLNDHLRRWRWKRVGSRPSGRAWAMACFWKDFQFVLGGWPALLLRSLCYIGLFCVSGLYNFRTFVGGGFGGQPLHESFQFAMVFILPVDVALLTAAAIQSDVRQQTLSTLMMLPQSVSKLVYSKLAGVLPGMAPGLIAFLISGWVQPKAFFHSTDQFMVIVVWMISVPHLAAALSMFLRWGAVPLAFGLTLGLLLCSEWFFHRVWGGGDLRQFGLYVVCPMYSVLCVLCHVAILFRLPRLAAR
jgi:hypothetical protein